MPLLFVGYEMLGKLNMNIIDLNAYGPQGEPRKEAPADLHSAMSKFQDALAKEGYGTPDIEPDGIIHRFAIPDDKAKAKSGWYVFYAEGDIPAGAFGNWKEGNSISWCSRASYEMTAAEHESFRRQMEHAKFVRDQRKGEDQIAAAHKAWKIYQQLPEAPADHPYLVKKGVTPMGGMRLLRDGRLALPLWDKDATFWGMQRIDDKGEKLFGKDVKVSGNFTLIDGDRSTVFVAEGYATGASIHMATGQAVMVAFNAGNLSDVVAATKQVFAGSTIIIAADDDKWTKKPNGQPTNPGQEKAHAAAQEHGVQVVSPDFRDLSTRPTDFNDLHKLEGVEEIRKQLQPAAFSIITMSDIMQMEFIDNPIIDGLLDERENLMVIGPSNVGKSLFSMHLALALAMPRGPGIDLNGPPMLFDRFAIRDPRRVLFLQSENTAKSTKKRLAAILRGRPGSKEALGNILTPTVSGGDCRVHGAINSTWFDQAYKIIRRSRADVVFIDPLVSFHDTDENENAKMRAALDRFNDLIQATGAAQVIIHHTGKDPLKGARGASAIRDWYDNGVILVPAYTDADKFVLRIIHDKSRNFMIQQPFFLERTSNLDYSLVEDPELFLPVMAIRASEFGVINSEKELIEALDELSTEERSRTQWQRIIRRSERAGYIRREKQNKTVSYAVGQNVTC